MALDGSHETLNNKIYLSIKDTDMDRHKNKIYCTKDNTDMYIIETIEHLNIKKKKLHKRGLRLPLDIFSANWPLLNSITIFDHTE